MVPQERRGLFIGLYSIGPLLGPIVGPIVGGFLAGAQGWRWVFWLIAIIGGLVMVLMIAFTRETYAPVLLQRKVDRLIKETGNPQLRSKLDEGLTPGSYFKRAIERPIRLLLFSPITTICAV